VRRALIDTHVPSCHSRLWHMEWWRWVGSNVAAGTARFAPPSGREDHGLGAKNDTTCHFRHPNRDLGEVLETARRAHGLTQAELADKAGIKQAALSPV
jgi:hypothetical protein